MNPFGNSGGDDFFGGGMGGSFGNPMGGMGGGNPRQGGYSFSSTFDSSRPEGQQYQEHHEPFGDYAGSRGGGGGGGQEHAPRGRGLMFSDLTRADNPFRRQVGGNPAGGYNASAREESSYPHMGREGPQYASRYEEYPRSHGSSRRQPPQQAYYDDESDPDEDPRQRQYYAPQHPYGGGGARGGGGGGRPSGGRLFNYDRFGRRN